MNMDIAWIVLRVVSCCIVFACFVFMPFKTRFRYNYWKTAALALFLTAMTAFVTVVFLTSGLFLSDYSTLGILLWLAVAVMSFRIAIKGSRFEILFLVLVVLNLYVNVAAIARVILSAATLQMPEEMARTLVVMAVLMVYIPFLWFLMDKLYKRVIEFNINFPFWKFIWVIPALTYMIFFVKIINDYWRSSLGVRRGDVVFIILWSFTTYVFFCVTLQMLIETHKGITAREQANAIMSQLRMQGERYESMLGAIENTRRLRHDWRHHLLSINGFMESGDMDKLQSYLKDLIPLYSNETEAPMCQNHVVDVLLQHHAAMAKSCGISMDVSVDIPANVPFKDTDLCIIFGNLVENAVEACMNQKENASIEIKARMKDKQLILLVKNTYEKQVIYKDNVYYSTKHEGTGIGLSSIKRVVEKNDGIMNAKYDDKYFTVNILLNGGNLI